MSVECRIERERPLGPSLASKASVNWTRQKNLGKMENALEEARLERHLAACSLLPDEPDTRSLLINGRTSVHSIMGSLPFSVSVFSTTATKVCEHTNRRRPNRRDKPRCTP